MGNDNLKPEMNSRQVQSKDSSFLVQSAGLAVFRLVKDDTNNAEQRVEWLLLQDNPRLIPNFTFIFRPFFHFLFQVSSLDPTQGSHWSRWECHGSSFEGDKRRVRFGRCDADSVPWDQHSDQLREEEEAQGGNLLAGWAWEPWSGCENFWWTSELWMARPDGGKRPSSKTRACVW